MKQNQNRQIIMSWTDPMHRRGRDTKQRQTVHICEYLFDGTNGLRGCEGPLP